MDTRFYPRSNRWSGTGRRSHRQGPATVLAYKPRGRIRCPQAGGGGRTAGQKGGLLPCEIRPTRPGLTNHSSSRRQSSRNDAGGLVARWHLTAHKKDLRRGSLGKEIAVARDDRWMIRRRARAGTRSKLLLCCFVSMEEGLRVGASLYRFIFHCR